ncbi:MAG TPA: TrkA C-terminal domain-containing protein [Phycisphaerales bacterium]|nr:TrkA C-terminal domain-containing protein [Phycisphaerales bacterium]HMP36365.1 TrkA C-terminal domain-containing protein [Phycisphaerales bacterium]
MLAELRDTLSSQQELVLLLVLAIGALAGRIRIGGFSVGFTPGTMLVAVAVGTLLPVKFSAVLPTIAFMAFMFAIGFRTGPQFVAALGRRSLGLVAVSLTTCGVALVLVVALARVMGFDPGTAAGLAAGALTQSAIVGSAGHALEQLDLPEAERAKLVGRVTVAYALTYLFGTIGSILICRDLVPRLLRIDLVAASAEFTRRQSAAARVLRPEEFVPGELPTVRAFRAGEGRGAGRRVDELERELRGPQGGAGGCGAGDAPDPPSVEGLLRRGQLLTPGPEVVVEADDIVLLIGRPRALLAGTEVIGPETDDASFDFVARRSELIVTHGSIVGTSLGEALSRAGRGVAVTGVLRAGIPVPATAGLRLHRGDTLAVVGARPDVARLEAALGFSEPAEPKLDYLLVCGGLALGALVGLLSVTLLGTPISLGAGGGALIVGLLLGWLRSVEPHLGTFPIWAQKLAVDGGLNLFIAIVGLQAGPHLIESLQAHGVGVVLAGVAVTTIPLASGFLVGRLLRIEPVLLVGAVIGAQTCSAALGATVDKAQSDAPTVGFTVPAALSNVLLTLWGPLIVAII